MRGRCRPDPAVFSWGAKHPQTAPLSDRSAVLHEHLIEAAKRGRLDQMLFWGAAADNTDAADDRPAGRPAGRSAGCPAGRPAGRPAERPAKRLAKRVAEN